MAKISRSKLARGAKLLVKHIFTPMSDAQTEFTAANVTADQLKEPMAPFRINLSIPRIDGASCRVAGPDGNPPFMGIPFMLPPLQEHLSFTTDPRGEKVANISDSAPTIVLDEVSFSFDQRLEPAAIVGSWDGGAGPTGADEGKLSYARSSLLNIELFIYEKRPAWFEGGAASGFAPGRAVWSGKIESLDLSAGYFRLNPWVASDIGEVIDPFKTYIFAIHAPNLATLSPGSVDNDTVLTSVEVSLRFRGTLVPRDSGSDIQNIPQRHLGNPNANLTHATAATTGAGINSATPRPLLAAAPVAGADVRANTADGVQSALGTIDEFARRKLQGGYTFDGDTPMLEEAGSTAAYTVLAVPLFNNTKWGGILSNDWRSEPYITSGIAGSWAIDRRYIPIEAPMTVHHVLFTYNWQRFTWWTGAAASVIDTLPFDTAPPPGQDMRLQIGVGIGTGMKGDSFGYQQIAYSELHNPLNAGTWFNGAVDRIAHGNPKTMPFNPTTASVFGDWPWSLELHAMNTVNNVGDPGPGLNGMASQGKPIFIGRSTSPTASRTDVGGGASAVAGQEQWIEVRARIGDLGADVQNDYDADSMILGSGGLWVYIIGKTHLV